MKYSLLFLSVLLGMPMAASPQKEQKSPGAKDISGRKGNPRPWKVAGESAWYDASAGFTRHTCPVHLPARLSLRLAIPPFN